MKLSSNWFENWSLKEQKRGLKEQRGGVFFTVKKTVWVTDTDFKRHKRGFKWVCQSVLISHPKAPLGPNGHQCSEHELDQLIADNNSLIISDDFNAKHGLWETKTFNTPTTADEQYSASCH
jgi:hypothetical protein